MRFHLKNGSISATTRSHNLAHSSLLIIDKENKDIHNDKSWTQYIFGPRINAHNHGERKGKHVFQNGQTCTQVKEENIKTKKKAFRLTLALKRDRHNGVIYSFARCNMDSNTLD